MRIAFSTNGDSIEDGIEPAFGRCRNFVIVDSDSGAVSGVPNPGADPAGGAGITAARKLASLGVDRLVTGSVGPRARPLLETAGVSIVTGSGAIRAHLAPSAIPERTTQCAAPTAASPSRAETTPDAGSGRRLAGSCYCEPCGYETDDDSGVPCFKLRCPRCGSSLERRCGLFPGS
jgi:predicted Fe-Mo cluster-binding NifX family protein